MVHHPEVRGHSFWHEEYPFLLTDTRRPPLGSAKRYDMSRVVTFHLPRVISASHTEVPSHGRLERILEPRFPCTLFHGPAYQYPASQTTRGHVRGCGKRDTETTSLPCPATRPTPQTAFSPSPAERTSVLWRGEMIPFGWLTSTNRAGNDGRHDHGCCFR